MSQPSLHTLYGDGGIRLAAESVGAAVRGTVLLAHGGGQTRHAWSRTAARLAAGGWRAVTLDLRGHGESDWSPIGDYRIERFAADLVAVSAQLGRAPALVGASLGGIAGMIVEAERAPRTFSSLTLVDITPQMDPGGVARVMGFMAEKAETGFSSLEEAAEFIAGYLPHRPRPTDLSGLSKNLRRHADGRYRWHWDPRFIESMSESRRERTGGLLAVDLSSIKIPIHLIRGRLSELVTPEAVATFMEAVPDAHFTDVENASHMVAGDRNDAFADAVLAFLDVTSMSDRANG